MEFNMINLTNAALHISAQTEKTTFHAKTTSAKLYIYIGEGSRDLFIDKAHTELGTFPVFFPCMLPSPLCGIFLLLDHNEQT